MTYLSVALGARVTTATLTERYRVAPHSGCPPAEEISETDSAVRVLSSSGWGWYSTPVSLVRTSSRGVVRWSVGTSRERSSSALSFALTPGHAPHNHQSCTLIPSDGDTP